MTEMDKLNLGKPNGLQSTSKQFENKFFALWQNVSKEEMVTDKPEHCKCAWINKLSEFDWGNKTIILGDEVINF